MAKLTKVTDMELAAAIKAEGLHAFIEQEQKVAAPNAVAVARTGKGNYLVYMTDKDGKIYNTSVHAEKELANGMVLRRLRALGAKAGAEASTEPLFTLRQSGPAGGDATAPYEVVFRPGAGDVTVREFLDAVKALGKCWGNVEVNYDGEFVYEKMQRAQYRYGEVKKTNITKEAMDSVIKRTCACGGWTAYDFRLYI